MTHHNAIRVRKKYRGENIYLILSFEEEGHLHALDISQSAEHIGPEALAGLERVANLVTYMLQNEYDHDELSAILLTSRLSGGDLAGIILSALRDYM